MSVSIDPRSAIVYFDLCFEDYNHEEDVAAAKAGNKEAAERLGEVLNRDPRDFGHALHLQESAAMREVQALLGAALPGRIVDNEGHDHAGNLAMKVGIFTREDAVALAELVASRTGSGEDCIYLNTAYFCAQGFRLYPHGVNSPSIALLDLGA